MPQTQVKCGPTLGIELYGARNQFLPGDVVTGYVYRLVPTVCPTAILEISLYGRAKSKIVENGYHGKEYRGEFTLVDSPKTSQTLVRGPIHIAAEGGTPNKWPFLITIPTHVDMGEKGHCLNSSFLSLKSSSIAQEKLPPSFEIGNDDEEDEAFVEYYLQARLALRAKGFRDFYNAIKPIRILRFNPGSSIESNNVQRQDLELSVSSFRLDPSLKNAKLSKSQKLKQVMGTPSVPSLTFKLEVGAPTVIQADDPNPFSFSLRAVPQWDQTSKVLQNVPQTLQLISLDIKIWTIVEVKTVRWSVGDKNGWKFGTSLEANSALKSLPSPIKIPCGKDSLSIDVGKVLKLGVPYYFNCPDGGAWDEFVRPGIVTHNIKITNQLRWEIEFEIAGECVKADGKGDLEVLWPPHAVYSDLLRTMAEKFESLMASMAGNENPPTFADVQAENFESLMASMAGNENLPTFADVQEEDQQAGRAPAMDSQGGKS